MEGARLTWRTTGPASAMGTEERRAMPVERACVRVMGKCIARKIDAGFLGPRT
jgi:hypothetical protein